MENIFNLSASIVLRDKFIILQSVPLYYIILSTQHVIFPITVRLWLFYYFLYRKNHITIIRNAVSNRVTKYALIIFKT